MQANCPKCGRTAFRMLPESESVTEVECLHCGHVAPFVSTVAPQVRIRSPKHQATGDE
jgi:uncharacterized metal-binding protein (TIGR02443 family)